MEKSADIEGDIANHELAFELAEHTAGQTAGKAINLAEKDREHDYADADEIRAEAISLEAEDVTNDLAAEEETRQNSYATAESGWLSAEAAAHIASTTIAAAATNTFLTDLTAADVGYVTAVAPLITSATQAFNNAVDAAYVAAFPGDLDQAAVSAKWTRYFNAMATAAQTAITSEATAYQSYGNGLAGDLQMTMNNIASEATQRATDYGNALTTYVSTVGAAATLQTSQTAAAGVVWIDSVATDVKNAAQNAANAWLQMADDGVDTAKILVDDYSNHWNGFVHSYLGAFVPHETNMINEDRQAAKDEDSQLTILAQGTAAEQHDLSNDGLNEWQAAALLLSPLDDVVVNAWAVLESAWSILTAWFTHASVTAAPASDFAYMAVGGAGAMSGLNHNLDLVGGNDEVVMQAALAATSTSGSPGSGGFLSSLGSSISSIGMFYQGAWDSVWGDAAAARKHYADAYSHGPLGQSTGAFHTGVQVSLGTGAVAMTAVVGMAAAGTSGPVLWGGGATSAELATVAVGGSFAHVPTTAGVATVEIGFIQSFTPAFIRQLTQTAIAQGARSAVINTGAVIITDLAIKLGLAAQNGTRIFGGTVTLLEGGAAPIFQIVIPLL